MEDAENEEKQFYQVIQFTSYWDDTQMTETTK